MNDALVSQMDIYRSLAKLVGVKLADDEAVDSLDQLSVWLGKSENGRVDLIEESLGNSALRHNQFKFIPKSNKKPNFIKSKKIKGGYVNEDQLYDLSTDPDELNNLAAENPELASKLQRRLDEIIQGRY
ncbi:hypothetical protein [Psychrosphaera algicola]|uniref:hypothetical protein n=1 Tax=Psychrosphaera algicola TaxID=3023714 RepID=UPI002FEE3877